tara:strand:+ start:626 stop:1075 length:450 start_codon:yes stop_codon:yes gene_type:complete
MIKKITIIIIIIFTTSCGFSPIYSTKNNKNLSISQVNFTGDRIINNFLKSNLNRYKNEKASIKISLDVTSNYKKIILTKDAAGKVDKYELITEVTFEANPGNKKFTFTEKKIMESKTKKSDERSYEIATKQTFANIITNNLINQLISFK